MERSNYGTSLHLDHRIKPSSHRKQTLTVEPLIQLEPEVLAAAKPVKYLFNSAFCGSTLLANCLDQPGYCLSYKEPLALSQLCLAKLDWPDEVSTLGISWQRLLSLTRSLLSKTFDPAESALVKPSYLCTTAIADLRAIDPFEFRGLFLYSDLQSFLCSTLKSSGRRHWVRGALKNVRKLANNQILRDVDTESLSDATAAAYVWVGQMSAYLDACQQTEGDLRSLSFDTFLKQPEQALDAIVKFFSLNFSPQDIEQIVNSQLFSTYSKPTALQSGLSKIGISSTAQRPFSKQERKRVLAAIGERYSSEIEAGLTWADKLLESQKKAYSLTCELLNSAILK
ncbi:hypothetical protein [Oscillatoria sp. CS-180]|uniref:hypothetical protein n=1 Tax=Oscillatoria sp. CS-180 TaxID=3021720 RepID=UPI00232F65F4|nr:hypothetical protein [Oscillatoria sp. CS-180]